MSQPLKAALEKLEKIQVRASTFPYNFSGFELALMEDDVGSS